VASDGTPANDVSARPSVSADGRFVAYESFASNLTGNSPEGLWAIYAHDRETGETTLLSVNGEGDHANEDSVSAAISADGRFVAYSSLARNLAIDSPQGFWAIYFHDRETSVTTLLTTAVGGAQVDGDSFAPAISADGQNVAFHATASNLVEGDTNARDDVFLHDRESGQTTRLSSPAASGEADDHSDRPAISSDGRVVAFESWATNLAVGDTNAAVDVFVSVPS
jgi:Tol biopolymer transport system component